MARAPRAVEVSVHIYGALLRAYPASFRRAYGEEMALVFRELATEALRQGGVLGLLSVWIEVLGDLAGSACREHRSELARRMAMSKLSSWVLHPVTVLVAWFLFLLALTDLNPAKVVFFLLVLGVPLYCAYLCAVLRVPLAYALGTLVVVVGTSGVACLLGLVLMGGLVGPDLVIPLRVCLLAVSLAGLAALVNLGLFVVRSRQQAVLRVAGAQASAFSSPAHSSGGLGSRPA